MVRLLEIVSAKVQQPPPLVSQLPQTFGSIPAPKISTPTSIPTLLVPQSGYLETTTVQSKFFTAMTKFSNLGKDNRDKMETFQVALGECDLLTLANGQRTAPILTTRNPGGYSAKTLIFKDDGSYDVILNVVTGKDLHYLIKHVLIENDSVQWFKIIYDHINGTKNSDIRKATDQLHQLKFKPTQSIQENVASIEEAFRVLNVASGVTITDDQKLYHLQEKLEHDVRVSVLSTMASAKTSAELYDITIKILIILDPAPTTAHKMAPITTSKELCRRHIAGLCTNGTQCKYSHALAPPSKGAPHRLLLNHMSRVPLLIRRTMGRLARAKLRTDHPSRNTLSSPKTIVHLSDILVASLLPPIQPATHSTSSHPSGHCSPLMLMDGQLETQTTSVVVQVSLILSGSMCLNTTDTFVALDEQLDIWSQCIRQFTTWIHLLSSRILS